MKSVLGYIVLLVLCLIFGIRDIVVGYNFHEILRLITGCFSMFLTGVLTIITILEILDFIKEK